MITPSSILGIDPGFDRVGYAVGRWVNHKLEVLACGLIQTDNKHALHDRYRQILSELEAVINQWQPTRCHLEKVFFSKNQKTAMQVSEARGVILGLLINQRILVQEFSPQEVKLAATGYGNADKNAMAKMIKMQVLLPPNSQWQDDTFDAIALLLAK